MTDYNYTKSPVNIDKLEQEIADESFGVSVTGTTLDDDDLTISFDGSLTTGEEKENRPKRQLNLGKVQNELRFVS